ncbi:MAG TPA: hypothetical protein VFW07_23210 [Parafilimonas sp.]|nr:hypothetical protein [Parafilimonas sp.]
MKRIFLAASLLIAATSFTGSFNTTSVLESAKRDGKHIPASEVPAPVMASFNENFPTAANVQWEKEKEHGAIVYQADFLKNGKRWRAVFAKNGTLLSSGRK